MDTAVQGQLPPGVPQGEGSKLPPVLANLMGNMNSSRSPQPANVSSNPAAPAVNVQELLSSIMVSGPSRRERKVLGWPLARSKTTTNALTPLLHQGASGAQSTEDLIKQPDFSDKIKQLLGSLQQTQNQNQNQNQGGPPQGELSSPFGRRAAL